MSDVSLANIHSYFSFSLPDDDDDVITDVAATDQPHYNPTLSFVLLSDDGGMCGEEYVVELQETVLLSDGENDGENDGVAVRSFSSDELVIQDAVEDVVAEDDEGVAVETCVMSLEGEEDEEDGVTVAEEELVEERENELHSSGDYLMISCETFILFRIICSLVLTCYLFPYSVLSLVKLSVM